MALPAEWPAEERELCIKEILFFINFVFKQRDSAKRASSFALDALFVLLFSFFIKNIVFSFFLMISFFMALGEETLLDVLEHDEEGGGDEEQGDGADEHAACGADADGDVAVCPHTVGEDEREHADNHSE